MDRARELALGDRLADLERLAFGRDRSPAEIDTAVYTDPARHAAELAAMRRNPLAAVPSGALRAPGDFVTVDVLGTPLLVTRDAAGVHAVVNACAHRGATVRTEPCGSARLHACRFHGWSYHLDGRLRSVAEPDRYGPSPDVRGLAPIACAERHGVVWVVLEPAHAGQPVTAPDLRAWLTPDLDDLLADLGLDRMVPHREDTFRLRCNWKLVTDGFLEAYHIRYLHRTTVAPHVPSNRALVDRYGPHFVTALPKNRLLRHLAEHPRDEWRVYDQLTMPVTLVPGTVVQWQAGHVELFSIRPDLTDPGRCRVVVSMLVPADRADDTDLWDRNWERLVGTIPAEDLAAAEDVYRNIAAGAARTLRVGATEHALVEHLAAVEHATHPTTGAA